MVASGFSEKSCFLGLTVVQHPRGQLSLRGFQLFTLEFSALIGPKTLGKRSGGCTMTGMQEE